ncbi:bifunctional metallophosphatase/5'-nucleotidase [Cohnella cholangitidis]|uniref:Bifunctional metallophosphatase/5'-nucleotidase n=1 Tax=Cohnella cholangitidis TaxID=2598458 RepID=A0A7G5BW22_9BACL|nr:bifunctional UDP-sugar hydrolase/5'-nucleotidase [Cohnella cholangitidis]QMV41156.1 bifunctional metallophosphatase/5'-nucleotidase [Cohnella cholangitidis]
MIETPTIQFTILATSDIHGHVLPIRYVDNEATEYGLLKLAAIIEQTRADDGHVLFIDNGDLLQGTPLAYYHACLDDASAHPIVDLMNALRLDAFIPGNHEFNYGLGFVNRAREQSEFPWLSANVLREGTDEPIFGCPYRIYSLQGGAKIGLLGLTTQYIPNWERPDHIAGLAFESAVSAAKRWIPIMKKDGADVIVVSYHGGFERDVHSGEEAEEPTGENEGWRLCRETEGIDVLITGHQHQRIEGTRVGKTLVVQPGYQGSCLAHIELNLQRRSDGAWFVKTSGGRLREAGKVQADPQMIARVQACEDNTQRWLDQPLCEVRGEMRVVDPMAARIEEHPLIELINRIQMEAAGVGISCTSLFDNLAPGFGPRVSMREVTANYPFPNTLKVLLLSGRDILEALEWTAAYFACGEDGTIIVDPTYLSPKPQHYNYDMWEGIEYEINVSRPVGSRIEYLRYQGKPIEPQGEYEAVMNHYRASGGGNYRMFRGKPIVREVTVDMTELIAEYLTKAGIVHAGTNGNWIVRS